MLVFTVVRRLMPFTALKHLYRTKPPFGWNGCAPPNAVYGIETIHTVVNLLKIFGSCAPPNAVYGIETPFRRTPHLYRIPVVRRLMPFTALKRLRMPNTRRNGTSSCAPPNAVYGIETMP